MTVYLIASCTSRKRPKAPDELRLRDVPVGRKRASKWLARLKRSGVPSKPARELYCGEHWGLVLNLEAALRKRRRDVELWVASAGYGLVSADAALKPYSATFASGQPDSVDPSDATAWWTELCRASPAKSLQRVVRPADTIVVIASARYLRAMLPDLQAAHPRQLIVFSGSSVRELKNFLVRVDSRVQIALGGSKFALAARAASRLLPRTKTWPPTTTAMQDAYGRLVSKI